MRPPDPAITKSIHNACLRYETDWLGHKECKFDVYFPVFTVCLHSLRDGHAMESCMATGWRVLMRFPDRRAELGLVAAPTPGAPLELVSVSDGAMATAALDQLREVSCKLDAKMREVRWLSIPGVMFEGFWLVPESPNQANLVSPVHCLDEELLGKAMEIEQFLPIVCGYAKWRLAEDDRPDYGAMDLQP